MKRSMSSCSAFSKSMLPTSRSSVKISSFKFNFSLCINFSRPCCPPPCPQWKSAALSLISHCALIFHCACFWDEGGNNPLKFKLHVCAPKAVLRFLSSCWLQLWARSWWWASPWSAYCPAPTTRVSLHRAAVPTPTTFPGETCLSRSSTAVLTSTPHQW